MPTGPNLSTNGLDSVPALVPAPGGAWLAQADGAVRRLAMDEARALFRDGPVLVAHALFVAGRLKEAPSRPLFDVLELFAFVRPAQPCVPSPAGIVRALGLTVPAGPAGAVTALHAAARTLLAELAGKPEAERAAARLLAASMGQGGWRWGPDILAVLGAPERALSPIAGFEVWRGLPQWEDEAPPAKPGSLPVEAQEVRARLAQLVGTGGEGRPEQGDYAEAAAYAFGPREHAGAPRIALIEAGTGIGKTLGYLAPASLWAEKNGPGLWLSTYTRNLQRQIVQEVARLYPDPAEREEKAVVRKGRENYLCLLNFEEAAKRSAAAPGQRSVALGLVARWIAATTDGDMSGAAFPPFSPPRFRCARSPTGAANASIRPVRITAPVSSSAPCAARAMRASSSPIMRSSSRRPRRTGSPWTRPPIPRPSAACAMSSTKAIIFSMPPIPALRPFSPARKWPICAAGSAGPRAAPARACAGSKNG